MAEKSVKCSTCGTVLTAANEDDLVKKLQKHAKDRHGKDMSESEAREAVKRGTD
jgi:predicted small metal-binding protein